MTRTHSARRPVSGFTLIELLVVTLILSILMAVAIPLYLSSVADARTKTCQANMQTIANAVQAAHIKSGSVTYTAIDPVDQAACNPTTGSLPDLQNVPTCPNGGHYKVAPSDTTGFVVSCDSGKDGSYTPGKLTPATGATGGTTP